VEIVADITKRNDSFTPLSAIFQLYHDGISAIPPICCRSRTYLIISQVAWSTTWGGIKPPRSVVIDAGCKDEYRSNCHAIAATNGPQDSYNYEAIKRSSIFIEKEKNHTNNYTNVPRKIKKKKE